ncbi:MAG: Crp/Fnr family transcriptional regulator [Bdellovibrionales bacterium]|nr:Crp/Fnr family transcriptional regulator [Bdellovibrionales bacterium]
MTLLKYKNIDLFAKLEEEELQALDQILTERHAAKGETIIRADDSSDSMMFLLKGKLRVSLTGSDGKEFVIMHLDQGEFVGEISLLTGEDRSADVGAIEDCTLLVLSRENFMAHTKRHTGLSQALLRELALRLRKTSLKLGELALLDVYRRVATTLRGIAVIDEAAERKVYVVDHRPTHQELSAMVGTSREMVTRALKGLEEDGHIKIEGKRIELYSLPL